MNKVYGIILCLMITVVSFFLGKAFPIVGGAVFAILIGILLKNTVNINEKSDAGINFCAKEVLKISIVFLGGGLNLIEIFKIGKQSIVIMLGTLAFALISAYIFGKLLKIDNKMTALIGVGTSICGGSAIAAISGIIGSKKDEISFAISTIFLYNIIAVIIFPIIGRLLNMSDIGFGVFAGTAVNDTSNVVATASVFGLTSLNYATVTKLARTTMIVPISLAFAFIVSLKNKNNSKYSFVKTFPWFIIYFLLMSLVNTFIGKYNILFLSDFPRICSFIGKTLIILALAGVGLGTSMKTFKKIGYKPVLLGLILWIVVTITSIILQKMSGLL